MGEMKEPLKVADFADRLPAKQSQGGQLPLKVGEIRGPRNVEPTLANAKAAIKELGIQLRFDVFRRRVMVEGYEEPLGETLDDIELRLRDAISERLGFDPGTGHARDAVRILALQNSFNPVLDYLDGLEWDGVPRLDTWLSRYLGAEDDELNRAIGRATLIAGVRRVRQPGAKFDFVLVLEGPQGSGKSTALKVLAGGETYFTDEIVIGENYKEQQELLAGRWIVELPELAGLSNAEVRRVKVFVSKTHDRARGAWRRAVEEVPRTCILIGTTNDAQYLRDGTGNRRFWPVKTGEVDLAALATDRDQLWAEAAHAELDADNPVTIPAHLWAIAAERQAERVVADPWEDILEEGLPRHAKQVDGELRITTKAIFEKVLVMEMRQARTADTKRLGECLRKLGWEGPKSIRQTKGVAKGYTKAGGSHTNGAAGVTDVTGVTGLQ